MTQENISMVCLPRYDQAARLGGKLLRTKTLLIPDKFTFNERGIVDFDKVLRYFDFKLQDQEVIIDLSGCSASNFQTLVLLIQYAWHLTANGCSVIFRYGYQSSGSTKMIRKMNAEDWRSVLVTDGKDFGSGPGRQTYALRRRADVQNTINYARRAIQAYDIGFPEYLSYIISELLYNATEHGKTQADVDTFRITVPSIFQFGYYPQLKRISFMFSDLGVGIKQHLEQTYPAFRTHQEAIVHALKPNVSGTFRAQSEPYASINNAGMGLNRSSLMMKHLRGDMYVASRNGLVHISPEDTTSRQLQYQWPGTFVLVNLNLAGTNGIDLDQLMATIEQGAKEEIATFQTADGEQTYNVGVEIVFGQYAEDKEAAIAFRDRYIMPAVAKGQKVVLDFKNVKTAPHSFLNALLATPAQSLGVKAYQKIKLINAPGFVHEIIDTVVEHNVPKL